MKRYIFGLIAGLLALMNFAAFAQDVPEDKRFTAVELFAESATVAPGQNFTVAFKMTPEPGWHTYWINPGDAGMETKIHWELPEGFSAGEVQFPAPETIPFSELVNYGYGHANTLLIEMTAPQTLPEGPLEFVANASWLVCDDAICVPEEDVLSMTLMPGNAKVDATSKQVFDMAREAIPVATGWEATYSLTNDGDLSVFVPLPVKEGDIQSAYLFPVSVDFMDHATPQILDFTDGGVEIATKVGFEPQSEEDLVLVINTGSENPIEAFAFTAQQLNGAGFASVTSDAMEEVGVAESSFLVILISAIVGGALLNIMPCVFPVLSLKALSLAKTSGNEKAARESGVFYTLGILISFAVVAGVLLAVRGAGEAVGWGFQLQSPIFVGLMALLMFVVGLNLFGFFEIGGRLAGVGSNWLARLDGRSEAFVTGTLATIVATPCTGPFMAPVLAYALTQSVGVALTVFLALGFGLALPFLILAFVPAARSLMPRPGAWMQTFKQFLGFPMVATAIWLLYVLNSQVGPMAVFLALFSFLAIAVGVWAFKHASESHTGARKIWQGVAALFAVGSVAIMAQSNTLQDSVSGTTAGTVEKASYLTFSPDGLDELRASGQPIFLYFTADWCITCKVNERAALKTDVVSKAFKDAGVQVMVGDWTKRDDEIGAVLKKFGRVGIPLYVYFGPNDAEPKVLGQILTPSMLTDLVQKQA